MRSVLSACVAIAVAAGCSSSSGGGETPSSKSSASSKQTSGGASTTGASSSASAAGSLPLPGLLGPYTTSGNKILDANGNEHFFRGLDRPSLEYSCDGDINANDYSVMGPTPGSWGANVVRLPLNQDCWLQSDASGNANPSYAPTYAATVDDQVQYAQQNGMDIILDLHWSDQGNFSVGQTCLTTTNGNCQQDMADAHSQLFWQQVATKYKNAPNVIFELYNEPKIGSYNPQSNDWTLWQNGGSDPTGGWTIVGMQQLVDTIRMTVGASNPIIIGGLNWAYDLTGVPSHPITGANIIYNTHPYQDKFPSSMQSDAQSSSWPASWTSTFGSLTATVPVIATEFGNNMGNQTSVPDSTLGCDATFNQTLIAYMNQQNSGSNNPPHAMSWTAWAFYPASTSCTFPSLIQDSNDDPNNPGNAVIAGLGGSF